MDKIIINQLIDEDFVNYKKPSMYIGFPKCDFKCEKECGMRVCQNGVLATSPKLEIEISNIINRYMSNFITEALVIAGLEPFDTYEQLVELIKEFRNHTDDDIVVYTGYYKDEIIKQIEQLKEYRNIIIKYGRFIPNQKSHIDNILEVKLVSDNQYAEKIS